MPMINEALKQIRLFHHMNQADLSHDLCICRTHLAEIESGAKPVTMRVLENYSAYFDIPMSSLMLFSENIDSSKKSDKLRLSCMNKIIKIMAWMNGTIKNPLVSNTREKLK